MDVEGLLKSLKEHKVRFVVIGATAFPVHGFSRATLDTDIFIESTPQTVNYNIKKLIQRGVIYLKKEGKPVKESLTWKMAPW